MARGFAQLLPPEALTVIVNVGDDARMYGAHVSPDLDTVCYTLAGINGVEGWGIANDTHLVMDQLATMGVDTTFRLGDRDLAHCLARSMHLDSGGTLSEFTRQATKRMGIAVVILPASDDPIRTKITTAAGEVIDFQDYFVLRAQRDRVVGVAFDGADAARPAPGVIDAIAKADIVVIAPSNPPLSIWPILAMPELGAAVRRHEKVIAVSPLIGGEAVKGPLVEVMSGLGLAPGTAGIAAAYSDQALHSLVIDPVDAGGTTHQGVPLVAFPTLMTDADAAAALAGRVLELA